MFFDFSSPNAYFAAQQLPVVAERSGATIIWRPFLLGGLFKALGTPTTPLMSTPAKARAMHEDLRRWAIKYAVPFSFPSRFPVNSVRALRCVLAVAREGHDAAPMIRSLFHAYWVDDADISDSEVLRARLARLGLDADATLAAGQTPEIKDALKEATAEAERRGVFGAPTFFVRDELFFGKDRLDFVSDALDAT
jgi:2-hydroxychromene-2-carboxylate isomerase